jgi:hypothetical protein
MLYLDDINLMNEYETINHARWHSRKDRLCDPEAVWITRTALPSYKGEGGLGFLRMIIFTQDWLCKAVANYEKAHFALFLTATTCKE